MFCPVKLCLVAVVLRVDLCHFPISWGTQEASVGPRLRLIPVGSGLILGSESETGVGKQGYGNRPPIDDRNPEGPARHLDVPGQKLSKALNRDNF